MLDFIGTILITAAMVVNLNSVISSLKLPRGQRIAAALAVGLWVGLAAASAARGLFAIPGAFPYIGLFVGFPLVATGALAALSPVWRTALLALPMPLLIGLNVTRILGVFFLLLAAAGRLSGPFPYSAGWGDILVGALALPAAWLAFRPSPSGKSLLGAWNLLGTADLVAAVALGVASAQGSPLQVLDLVPGSAAVTMLPWAFIPTVLVPFYLIVHAILFAQLRQARRADAVNHLSARSAPVHG